MTDEVVTLEHLVSAYRSVFRSPGGDLVLRDLAEFCHAATTTFIWQDGIHQAFVHEGRRQAFLRIAQYIVLDAEEMMALRAGRRIIQESPDA